MLDTAVTMVYGLSSLVHLSSVRLLRTIIPTLQMRRLTEWLHVILLILICITSPILSKTKILVVNSYSLNLQESAKMS